MKTSRTAEADALQGASRSAGAGAPSPTRPAPSPVRTGKLSSPSSPPLFDAAPQPPVRDRGGAKTPPQGTATPASADSGAGPGSAPPPQRAGQPALSMSEQAMASQAALFANHAHSMNMMQASQAQLQTQQMGAEVMQGTLQDASKAVATAVQTMKDGVDNVAKAAEKIP